jgi:hypothetical protein
MFRNFFQSTLGQILIQMNDEAATYIIALPCHDRFVRLACRVPRAICRKLKLDFWLVEPTVGLLDYHLHMVENNAL